MMGGGGVLGWGVVRWGDLKREWNKGREIGKRTRLSLLQKIRKYISLFTEPYFLISAPGGGWGGYEST